MPHGINDIADAPLPAGYRAFLWRSSFAFRSSFFAGPEQRVFLRFYWDKFHLFPDLPFHQGRYRRILEALPYTVG